MEVKMIELVNFNYKEEKVVSRYSTKFERNLN